MRTLITELTRLYLLDGQSCPPAGEQAVTLDLVNGAGLMRTLVIEFGGKGSGEQHWSDLCAVANALHEELELPAPAVAISGTAYQLWLSLETLVPQAQAQRFLQLLRTTYLPVTPKTVVPPLLTSATLPPCLQPSGKWAAFIHPGMGASFADDPGLEMAPPHSGQLAFIERLKSISLTQFTEALTTLQGSAPASEPVPVSIVASNNGLLLQDATLEDIVQWLHARGIEPTFRHVLR